MKHTLNITLLLILLFLTAHVLGLVIIKHYLPAERQLPLNIEKPQLPEKTSFIPITITLLIATVIALVLVKFHAFGLWKLWFFLSVFFTLVVAFSVFIHEYLALILGLAFTFFKVFKPNVWIHNFTELFIYGGLAAIFVPILTLSSVIILLLIFSVYDMIAVWKTQHMITLAKFQSHANLFAGLSVNYKMPAPTTTATARRVKTTPTKGRKPLLQKIRLTERQALLGGGDIGFPLFFSGVILKTYGFAPALLTSITAAIALYLLFVFAEQKKFYPAMPFLAAGSLAGYGILRLFL